MKKLLVITSLALTLTVNSVAYVLAQENTTTQINKELNESKFKSILTEPSNYFDFKVSDAKYVVKNTDTEYLLLAATSEEAKGLYNIRAFAYDRGNNKVVELDDEFVVGDSSTSWLKGTLEEYSNNSNKLRYTVKSESVDKFEIKDIIFENNGITDEAVKEGSLSKDKLPSANVKEIEWKNLEISKATLENGQSTSASSSTSEKNVNKPSTEMKDVPQKQAITIDRKQTDKKSKLDINAIASGDLTSVYGTYGGIIINNSKTMEIEEKDNRLAINSIKKEGEMAVISSKFEQKQPVTSQGENAVDPLMLPNGGVEDITINHYVVPAGVASPVEGLGDDINRDRVIIQGHGIEFHYVNP